MALRLVFDSQVTGETYDILKDAIDASVKRLGYNAPRCLEDSCDAIRFFNAPGSPKIIFREVEYAAGVTITTKYM
jgi:hypothetical protein